MTSERGFTLVELMMSLVLFGLVVAGLLSVAGTMAVGFRAQRSTLSTEDSARTAIELLADALRGASPGVPVANIQHVNTCATGALSVVNSSTAPDQLTAVFASGAVVTSLRTPYGAGTTGVTVADATQLAAGDTVLITDLDRGHLATIQSVNSTSGAVGLVPQSCSSLDLPTGGYAAGSLVIRALRATFSVAEIDGVPTLMMDRDAEGPETAEPFADGIEDLQVALGVDADNDGALAEGGAAANDDEWNFNVAGETLQAGPVRAIRVTVVARASKPVVGTPAFYRPYAEDRAGTTQPDGFRRRSTRTTIEIRNLGGSP